MRYMADGSDRLSRLILVKPNSHAGRNEVLHIEKSLLCGSEGWVKCFFLWLKNLILSETCSVRANGFLGNGRVKQVNWLNLSESASASTKPKTNLTNWVSLFEVHSGPKCCMAFNTGKITLSPVSGPL